MKPVSKETWKSFVVSSGQPWTAWQTSNCPAAPAYQREETQLVKLRDQLGEGWQEINVLSEKTGLGTSRVHTLIAKLRRNGENIQTLSFKKYRIPAETK